MITHSIIHNSIDDFKKVMINEPDNIVGYYLELHKNGSVRGSYITDNRYPAVCTYEEINQAHLLLSKENPRTYKNICVELYMENYSNFIAKEVGKMHSKWKQVEYDDIKQMFYEAVVKCYNKNGYILNSRLILRSFYNTVYTYIRHEFHHLMDTVSIEEPISSDENVTIADTIEDENENPQVKFEEQCLEEDKVEKLALIGRTLKELGYGERTMKNILFELEKHALSRQTRNIIDRVKERLRRDGWID